MPRRFYLLQKLSSVLQKPDYVKSPDQLVKVIVETSSRAVDRIATIVNASQGKVYQAMRYLPFIAAELPFSTIQELIFSHEVKRIWPDSQVQILLDVAVPVVGSAKVQDELGMTGKDVAVAVLDTGISQHPDLTRPQNRIIAWNDLINGIEAPYDDNGHGTHVAGIIAGNGYSSRGKYKGMAPEANLVGVKVIDRAGAGNFSDIIAGIEWVMDHRSEYNIKALNLSIGAIPQESYRNDPLCRATTAAWNSGIVVCAAAGNDGPDSETIHTPGINPKTITVGNLDDRHTIQLEDDRLHNSSSRGPTLDNLVKPDVLAPGTGIISLRPLRGYRTLTGSSMSTPMVTGAVAQIAQKWPNHKPDQIKNVIAKNARNIDLDPNDQGVGVLDLEGVFRDTGNNQGKKNLANLVNVVNSVSKKAMPAALLYTFSTLLSI